MGLSRCRFQLGDFVPFMQETDERFDFVVSSGVLYHQTDPLGFLEAVARVGRRVAIWTHYFDPSIVAADPAQARFFLPEPEIVEWSELQISLHRRNYLESLGWGGFCGGPATSVLWMERDDLFAVLHRLGYDRIEVMHDDRTHPFGARIMLFAEQT
jgi:SAM-dependent methyltransferase